MATSLQKSQATAQGLRDGIRIAETNLDRANAGGLPEPCWSAALGNFDTQNGPAIAGPIYVASLYPEEAINPPLGEGVPYSPLSPTWPVGTGDDTGLVNRWASCLAQPTRTYTATSLTLEPVLSPNWSVIQATEARNQIQRRLSNLEPEVQLCVDQAARVGPPWQQPTA